MAYTAHIGEHVGRRVLTFDKIKDLGFVFTTDEQATNLVRLCLLLEASIQDSDNRRLNLSFISTVGLSWLRDGALRRKHHRRCRSSNSHHHH